MTSLFMGRLRLYANRIGISVQWWDFWPMHVVTLYWPNKFHRAPRLRLHYWRGRHR